MKPEPLQAVVTTGIYCRASCSARPAARNVRAMPSPVAAEARGFRACLKCRSDQVEVAAATDSPEVARAMMLISDGYLDRHGEEELAAEVGYSSRQLRRLFEQEIGATPDFVARSRRAHFARRLLDETRLTITEIAFASGFNSVRQMNRVVRDIFSFTPSELRARRRRNQGTVTDGGLTLTIAGSPAARLVLAYLRLRAIPGVERVDDRYRRTIVSCGHPGVLEVEPAADDALAVTAHLASFGSLVDDVARVKRLFATSPNPAASEALGHDVTIGQLVRRRPWLAMPGAWDRFEISVRIIIGQQISVGGAGTITSRLVQRLGTPIPARLENGLTHTFPSPADIAEGDLSGIGLTHRREETLRRFAAGVNSGAIPMAGGQALHELTRTLEALPGIGPWTSHLIAARAFGHEDAFPASDLGLRKAAAKLTNRSQPLSTRQLTEMAEAWRPYRATAAAHLWFEGAA